MILGRRHSRAFTLIEMIVAVSLLLLIIGAVGTLFQGVSKAVSMGNATTVMITASQGVQRQLAQDIPNIALDDPSSTNYGPLMLIIRGRWRGTAWNNTVNYEVGDHVVWDVTNGRSTPGNRLGYRCIQANTNVTPGTSAAVGIWEVSSDRIDQLAFLAYNSEGYQATAGIRNSANTLALGGASPFYSGLSEKFAFIWYGHMQVTNAAQNTAANVNDLPVSLTSSNPKDSELVLGRHVMLLTNVAPVNLGNGYGIPVGPTTSPNWYVPTFVTGTTDWSTTGIARDQNSRMPMASVFAGLGESVVADISSGRISVAFTGSMTAPGSANVKNDFVTAVQTRKTAVLPNYRAEADSLCFRYKTLPTPKSADVSSSITTNLINGAIRTIPQLQKGVASFAVEWTDGANYKSGAAVFTPNYYNKGENLAADDSRLGTMRWYGPSNFWQLRKTDADASVPYYTNGSLDPVLATEPALTGSDDDYTAIFSIGNYANQPSAGPMYAGGKQPRPRALRITYRITDPKDRLEGGRTFVQVIQLP